MIKAGNPNNYKSCSDCGITHTPLWRGGPLGPKTMCNACGIRWKRANQSGKNKQHHEKISKAEYPSDDEKTEYDSAEELLALSDPENNFSRHSPRDSADSNDSKRRSKTMKKKPLHSAGRNSKPYSRPPLNNRDLENEAEDSMLILQQAAEEFDRLGDFPADDSANEPSSTGSSLNGSANTSPTPIDMTSSPKHEDVKDKMDQLFSEVMALREEVQKRDAIIDMYKHSSHSTSYSSSSLGRSPQELPPVIAH